MLNTIQDVESSPLPKNNKRKAIEMMAMKGNLENRDFEKLQTIQVKIEEFELRESFNSYEYEVTYRKVPEIYLHIQPSLDKRNNIFIPEKKVKVFQLNRLINMHYFRIVDYLFQKYSNHATEIIFLKTFVNVDQSLYEPGMEIEIHKSMLTQYVEIKEFNGKTISEKLNNILP